MLIYEHTFNTKVEHFTILRRESHAYTHTHIYQTHTHKQEQLAHEYNDTKKN